MSLHNFPMDTETCSLSLQSFAYDTDEIVLMFDANAINAAKEADPNALFMDINLVNNMPKFKIIDHGYNYSKSDFMIQEEGNEKPQVYQKSRLTVTFEFERYFISVFFQSYFPAMIMVMLGGLTMWIDPKSVPARVSMGITTVLTISTIITGLKSSLPRVSYLTALDIYLWTCYFFVFSAVLEFCVLNFLMARKGRVRDKLVESRIKNSNNRQKNGMILGMGGSAAGLIAGQGIAVGPTFVGKDQSRQPTNANYDGGKTNPIDDSHETTNYLLEKGENQTVKKRRSEKIYNSGPKVSTCHNIDQSFSDRSFSKSIKKIYSIFNVHESPDTARRLDFYFRYLYFLMFALFNAIYWTHVKMAAAASREVLAKNFGPVTDGD